MKEIRIRELRYDEAKALLERELEKAFLSGEMRVYVLHGIGEGILKQMTLETAESLDYARVFTPGTIPYNPGITVIDLFPPDPSVFQKYMK